MVIMKKILLLVSNVFLAGILLAQVSKMRFERISIEDGLSQVCVNNIIQDSQGFMWFATEDGLNRFDGYSFTVFKPSSTSSNSLSNNVVKTIYEDSRGVLWVGTAGGGLNKFDKAKETFTSYRYDPFDKSSISNNDVYALFEDSKGNFWVGTFGGGLNLFDREKEMFVSFRNDTDNPASISGNAVRAIIEDADGNIWVGLDEGGVNKFDLKTKKFTRFNTKNGLSNDVVMSLYLQGADLYIGTYGGGLNVFNTKSLVNKVFVADGLNRSLSNNIVWTITPANGGRLYIGTRGGGVNVFDIETEKFIHYEHNPAEPSSLSGMNVLSVFQDRSGVVWFGTESAGINKYNASGKNFGLLQHQRNDVNSLSNNNVFSIFEDKVGNIWLGTRGGGLNRYNQRTKRFTRFENEQISNILSFRCESENKYWLGTDGNGFFCIDTLGNIKHHFQFDALDANSVSNNAISALLSDTDSLLWIGTFGGGLNLFDQKLKKFRNFPIDRKNAMKNVVRCLYQGKDGIIWIGTGGHGLVRFDKNTYRSVSFENSLSDPHSISNNVVLSILEDRKGIIWVGTGGGGLNRFDRSTGEFISYTQADGLCNDFVVGIVEDSHGNLWMSTYNGLSKFNPDTKEFKNYSEKDGLQGNTFNERAYYRNNDGVIFLGGVNGLTFFNQDSILDSKVIPPVVITDLKIFNKSVAVGAKVGGYVVLKQPVSSLSELTLSHKHSVFTIEFSALHYAAPEKNLYRYKMEGFDVDWIETSAENRMATYTNLSGGKYVFKVQAANSDGVWNEEGASIKLTIIPPFYKTSWFYSLVIIFVLIGIYLFVKLRERQLIKDNIRLEETVKERTQEINQQKEELKLQSELLARNNDELTRNNILITDSISYAKRIQEAVLPSVEEIKKVLPNSFIFYSPRDIVSGDFYWFSEVEGKVYVVVADCTGHGVPGAFMSMIGTTLLNDIVMEQKVRKPSEILGRLNVGVITALNQTMDNAESQDDGMDVSVCMIDRKEGVVTFACANHNVHYVENGELKSIQGDIYSVGGIFSLESKREYTDHTIPCIPGTSIYMFSDGYQDQFGGPKNKKFLATNFRSMLYEISSLPIAEQHRSISSKFSEWKAEYKQVDDVLVMGISLS